jgi:hypothetical protein
MRPGRNLTEKEKENKRFLADLFSQNPLRSDEVTDRFEIL